MPTSWTERTASPPAFAEGFPGPSINGFALFGMPIPIVAGTSFADPTTTWTERTASATAGTERSVSATAWTERSA